MVCGTSSLVQMDVHEMVRRSHAPKQWCIEPNFLLVCRRCHDEKLPNMPVAKQLAYKMLCDPLHFSVDEINRIGSHPWEFISLPSVVKWFVHIVDKEGCRGS